MSTLIYIDTNIYLDYLLEDRCNEYGKPLGPDAFRLFNRAIHCEFEIILSAKVLEELYKHCPLEKTRMLFGFLKKKLKLVIETDEEIKEAKEKNEHYQDALHAILANKYEAEFLVTRNTKDFRQYSGLVEIIHPAAI